MTIYFFFNSSGTNIVWISTTHAIKAMRNIGTQDNPIDNINHPVERKKIKRLLNSVCVAWCTIVYSTALHLTSIILCMRPLNILSYISLMLRL